MEKKEGTFKRIYLIWFLLEFNIGVFWSIWSVNVIDQGHTYFDACIALAIYLLVIALLEIPTGMIGDRFGHKKTTMVGIIVSTLGFFLLSVRGPNSFLYASLATAALGISLCNGSKQVWFIDAAKSVDETFNRDRLFVDLEIPRRIAQIVGAYIGSGLNHINPAYTWYAIAFSGLAAALVARKTMAGKGHTNSEPASMLHNVNDGIGMLKPAGLWLIFLASFFYGIDLAIRGLVLAPYVVKILSDGDSTVMGTVTLVSASMGILGNKYYKYIRKRHNIDKTIFIIASLMVYSFSESVFAYTNNFYVFFFLYSVCVFTMGWFVALHDAIILDFITDSKRASYLSAASMLRNLSAALTLMWLAPKTETVEHLQSYWTYASRGLLLCGICYTMLFLVKRYYVMPFRAN